MTDTQRSDQRQETAGAIDMYRPNGHPLIQVTQWLPGSEPTDYELDLSEGDGYQTRFWRCTHCGQERTRRSEFAEQCAVATPPMPLEEAGYDIDDPRTRRALVETMVVHFGRRGGHYTVDSESGATYEVDIARRTCTCPDFAKRGAALRDAGGCKHVRRVDLDIRVGTVPRPDGTFRK